MSDSERIAQCVMDCPHREECQEAGSKWGESEEVDGEELHHRPSPHVGGDKIDEFCVYVLGQNPGDEVDTMKNRSDYVDDYLMMHDYELRTQFTPSEFIADLQLDWDYVVWENVVRCLSESMNSTLKENCSMWTAAQLATFEPEVVIAMGSHARDWLNDNVLSTNIEFGEMVIEDRVYFCIPHYSYLMRQGDYEGEVNELQQRLEATVPEEAQT